MKNCVKIIKTAIISLVFSGLLIACTGVDVKESDTGEAELSKTIDTTNLGLGDSSTLKVGMEIGYPPFEYMTDGKEPTGFDVELGRLIGRELGLEVQFINTSWDGIFDGLQNGNYDTVISAVAITEERRNEVNFSEPYIENWQQIIVRKGYQGVNNMADLNGLKIAFQGGTTSETYVRNIIDSGELRDVELVNYDKVMNCFDDLTLERVDAVIADSLVGESYINRQPDLYEEAWNQKFSGGDAEFFGVAMKKGNDKLRDAINDILARNEANGTIPDMRKKWWAE